MSQGVERALSPDETKEYLQRIGMADAPPISVDGLSELIHAHHITVPFENLSLVDLGEAIELGTDQLYDKIVTRRRGGYCFELNGAFCSLLRGLGFDAFGCLARIRMFDPNTTRRLHRVNAVNIGGKLYFADVGFGGPMSEVAIEIAEGSREGVFCFGAEADGEWTVFMDGKDGLSTVLSFYATPASLEGFEEGSAFCSTSPESRFTSFRMVNLTLDGGGHYSINGTVLSLPDGTRELNTRAEYYKALEERFGLVFPLGEKLLS